MTAQISERLLYHGADLALCAEPLRRYLETIRPDLQLQAPSTALWRGYVGTWSIECERLYLVRFHGFRSTPEGTVEIGLRDLFPGFPEGVLAHWFTGELRCPKGRLLQYVHGGYGSRYEQDLFLQIEQGRLVGQRLVDNALAGAESPQAYPVGAKR